MREYIKKPELLAPAGNLSVAIAAFEAGADAVYAGLNRFNARERTENFDFISMSKLINYARKKNKKVYIALNTLIKENEIDEVAEYIFNITQLEPDGVIIQDLGVVRIIRRFFPSLHIHASTQFGIHNSSGVSFAASLGIKRVILERQVTLKELEEIVRKSSIEIEVFIHGALCCSISGHCLLSSWLGGWSGNRGKCKQPCRRRYFSEKGNGFLLSTKDLASLKVIERYKELGITSLKIEGRLKKSDYVVPVVSAYRMLIDADTISKEVIKEASKILTRSLGRKWTDGFISKDNFNNIIESERIGVSGLPSGEVISVKKNGFYAKIDRKLHIGDRLRIQPKSGREGPTLTLTKIFINNKSVFRIPMKSIAFIPCDKNDIPKGGIIYKIGECYKELSSVKIDSLPEKPIKVDLKIAIKPNNIVVTISNLKMPKKWRKEILFDTAKNRPLNQDIIRELFTSNNLKRFSFNVLSIDTSNNLFLPISRLKAIRREFWNWFQNNINEREFIYRLTEKLESFKNYYRNRRAKKDLKIEKTILINEDQNKPCNNKNKILSRSIYDKNLEDANEIVLPEYCFEDRLPILKQKIYNIIMKGKNRFRITSIYQLDLLKDFKNISVSTSFPLPVANSFAAEGIAYAIQKRKLKLQHIQCWIELEKEAMELLIEKSEYPLEIFKYGRIYLLVTRANIPIKSKDITDSKGEKFHIEYDKNTQLYYLYPKKIFKNPEKLNNCSTYSDLRGIYIPEKENRYTSNFNLYHEMK